MDREQAHQLLDQLEPGQFEAVVRLLQVLTEPAVSPIGDAPFDDEPTTAEEENAVAASKEWFQNNRGIPFEEVVSDLGFTMEQIRRHQGRE